MRGPLLMEVFTDDPEGDSGVEIFGVPDPVEGISIMVFSDEGSLAVWLGPDQREALAMALLGECQ